jgi:hypothetical protein
VSEPKYKNVRILASLLALVKKRAQRTKRSITKEVEALLEDALRRSK